MTLAATTPLRDPTAEPPPRREDLLADLHNLPAQRTVLLHVLRLAETPDCSMRVLGDAAGRDPAFAARLLRLANSAHYGRAKRVTAISSAVTLVGVETVRGLAVTMALGLTGEHGPLPEGFWERGTTTAAGSQLVAPAVGAAPGDAFCVGLLREVGQALLFRAAPASYSALCAASDEGGLASAERAWCGVTNGELAAAALGAAGLPESICHAIVSSQVEVERGISPTTPLGRALRAGVLLSRAVAAGDVEDAASAELHALTSGALPPAAVRTLVLRTAAQAAALSSALG